MNTFNNYQNYMPKKIGIEEFQSNEGRILRMNFLNGIIDLKVGEYGAYAICPGCGAGKTTNIRNLISLKWYEGVLYSAFTKNELNEMYQFCKTLVGSQYQDPITKQVITLKMGDILVLHSDFSAEGTDNNLWRHNPQEIANKKIVLCTHAKLLDEPLSLLINANFNPRMASILGNGYAAINGYSIDATLPRQWILIDEATEAKKLMRVKKSLLMCLGNMVEYINVTKVNPATGEVEHVREKLSEAVLERRCNTFFEFKNNLIALSKMNREFSGMWKDEVNELNKYRNEQLQESMFYNYFDYVNNHSSDEYVSVYHSYTNVINPDMKTHMLLFDGTSDITMQSSRKFEVKTYHNKYNSEVNLFRFPFRLNRKLRVDEFTDIDLELRENLDKTVDTLETLINQNQKTLIFCWKNFKGDNGEVNDEADMGNSIAQSESSVAINPKFSIPSYLSMRLNEKGFLEGENYSIEYYGSGKDKATNIYREYDAVVLLGRYNVPSSVVNDFNLMNHSSVTSTEYYANRVIQAICRSRIRLHNGLPINVYMSNDWSEEVLRYVADYLTTGVRDTVVNSKYKYCFMVEELRKKGITPKKAEQIAKLSQIDHMVYDSIMNGILYNCKVGLDEIFKVIPMSRKEVDKYSGMTNWMSKYGIYLTVIGSRMP